MTKNEISDHMTFLSHCVFYRRQGKAQNSDVSAPVPSTIPLSAAFPRPVYAPAFSRRKLYHSVADKRREHWWVFGYCGMASHCKYYQPLKVCEMRYMTQRYIRWKTRRIYTLRPTFLTACSRVTTDVAWLGTLDHPYLCYNDTTLHDQQTISTCCNFNSATFVIN